MNPPTLIIKSIANFDTTCLTLFPLVLKEVWLWSKLHKLHLDKQRLHL